MMKTNKQSILLRSALLMMIAAVTFSEASGQSKTVAESDENQKTVSFSGFFQPRFDFTGDTSAAISNSFSTKRFEIKINAVHSTLLESEFSYDVSVINNNGTGGLRNALLKINIDKAFVIKAGQFYKPVVFENFFISSSDLRVIDRGLMVRELDNLKYSNRDIGIMIQGQLFTEFLPVSYFAGIFNGEGLNKSETNSGKNAAFNLNAKPVSGLTTGFSISTHAFTNKEKNEKGIWVLNDSSKSSDYTGYRNACNVYAEYKIEGFSIAAEYAVWDNFNSKSKLNNSKNYTADGFYIIPFYSLTTGNTVVPKLDFAVKVEQMRNFKASGSGNQTNVTVSTGVHLSSHSRLQIDWISDTDKSNPSRSETINRAAVQFTAKF